MRKKILTVLVVGLFSSQILAGCGNNSDPVLTDEGVVNVPTDTPTATETPEATVEPTETPTPELTEEPTPEPPKDWFEAHGIEITPQGDFTYTTMAANNNHVDVGTFEVLGNVVITESTDGVEEGYKEVKMLETDDLSAVYDIADSSGYKSWRSAFDRYTGISFEFDSTATYTDRGQSSNKAGFVTIFNGDTSYDVSISFEIVNEYPIATHIITVTCPVDYDGVVFQIGYSDSELFEANQEIDYAARLYTIDELLFYGDGYYYFSYSNE